jgi:hypothetical protein
LGEFMGRGFAELTFYTKTGPISNRKSYVTVPQLNPTNPNWLHAAQAQPIDHPHGSTTPRPRQAQTSQDLSRTEKSQTQSQAARAGASQTKEGRVSATTASGSGTITVRCALAI